MPHLMRLASMIHDQVHAITPGAAEAVLQALDGRAHTFVSQFHGQPAIDDRTGRPKGYRITAAGVGILPIVGELVARGGWIGASSGVTSYEGLREVIKAIAADPDVKAVVLDVDSPGGMVTGMFETAAMIKALAAAKPVIAVANPMMASAAYALASQANSIIAVPDSAVGSIGVLYVHADRSAQLAMQGVRVSIIQAGEQKTAGNSLSPLPDSLKAEIQARIDAIYGRFVDLVAGGRPLTARQIRDTQARVFVAEDAVAAGLADEVATFDDVIAAVESRVQKPRAVARTTNGARSVNLKIGEPAANDAGNGWAGMSLAEFDAAVDTLRSGVAETIAAAAAKPIEPPAPPAQTPVAAEAPETPAAAYDRGRTEERARVKGILTHADAQGRQRQAQILALGTDLPVDQAAAVLKEAPLEAAAQSGTASDLAVRQGFYNIVAAAGGNPKVAHQGEAQTSEYKSTLGVRMQKMTANLAKKEAR
ncbi:MAG: S49 family peptidase [Hyphomicrobiaceae bacterium]